MLVDKKAVAADSARAWLRFVQAFAVTVVTVLAVIYLFMLVLDPYDSGRMTNYAVSELSTKIQERPTVSRGRDPRFNSAVIAEFPPGNCLIRRGYRMPQGLALSNSRCQELGRTEQLTVLRWFIRHHQRIGAVLLVANPVWCAQNLTPGFPPTRFRFGSYSESIFEYATHILDAKALDLAWRRTLLWLGSKTRSRPDGRRDYEAGRTWGFSARHPGRLLACSDASY